MQPKSIMFVAVPIMAGMMLVVASRRDQIGRFTGSLPVLIFGWVATELWPSRSQ